VDPWLPTILIFVPVLGALVVWLVPMDRLWAGITALATMAVVVGFWIVTVVRFDFAQANALQLTQNVSWFSDLDASYSVGLFGFSVWLIGLAVVVMTAAVAYAFRAGRERPRAYFGLMLFLTGAVIGVFVAQDLLLFYVFWEAMLIPLYILIGVWGGARRGAATVKFVIYTMVGSLLMLASIIYLGVTAGSFDMFAARGNTSIVVWLGFAAAFAVKAPLFPFHGWLPDAYRQSSPEVAAVLSGLISKTAAYGFLRITLISYPEPAHELRTTILVLATIGLIYGSLLAFRAPDFRGVVAYSSLAQMGLIMLGLFAMNLAGLNGSILQMVNHGLLSAALFLLAGSIEQRSGSPTGEFSYLGGLARGRPALATILITVGVIALAVPGSTAFAGEFLILLGVFATGWAWAVLGGIAIVLAAMYMLRLISAVLHRDPRPGEGGPDLRFTELSVLVPIVACLIALSVWPAAITDHTFGDAARNIPALFDIFSPSP
jgi:NADH-quinone oxidoreductase subunit M